MAIGNSSFHPSIIENHIYDLMDNPKYVMGAQTYTDHLFPAVHKMFYNEFPAIEWQSFTTQLSDNSGGTVSLAWIEDGHLHLIGWDFVYER